MAKSRRLTLLITLGLLIATAGIAGHFVVDTVCMVLDTADGVNCSTEAITGSSSDNSATNLAGLHSSFNLPPSFPELSLLALTFILAPITFANLPYTPSLSPPPPKSLP